MFAFITEQIRRTLRRPSRLIRIPLRLAGLGPVQPLDHLEIARERERFHKEEVNRYFNQSSDLLQNDRPDLAWIGFASCLRESRESLHYFVGAVCLIQGLGRFDEGCSLLDRNNALQAEAISGLGLPPRKHRLFSAFWVGHIGHLATIDYIIKSDILEGRSRENAILYIPPETKVGNRFLAEQWRPYAQIVERPEDLPFPAHAANTLEFSYLAPPDNTGSIVYFWELAAKTYRRWHAEGRAPLLELSEETEERGWKVLERKGVPRDAWFVGLHVREAGSKQHHNRLHQVLNADIMDYLPAIEEIVRRGGWVLRMGDDSMASMPTLPNVIDYCHSDIRSDWMDIFICARSRFFIGTSSGPAYVPPLYGVPSVLTNWWPPGQRPWHPTDIFIPKMLRRVADRKILKLIETLDEPFSFCHSLTHLEDSAGVVVENNEPWVIRGAVLEMIERLEGRSQAGEREGHWREDFERIYRSKRAFGMGRLARAVLDAYPDFV